MFFWQDFSISVLRGRSMKKKADSEVSKKKTPKKDYSASYNKYKIHGGKQYTGMKIGRSHKWYYDQGIWRERKVTPDEWEIEYKVPKRRAGKAPERSGAPVGTEYNWYILSKQWVKKLDANTYDTAMTGQKFKLAHKRADSDKWSASDKAQRKKIIKILQQMIADLEIEQQIEDAQKKGLKRKTSKERVAEKTKRKVKDKEVEVA
jgi:hypothetical protein